MKRRKVMKARHALLLSALFLAGAAQAAVPFATGNAAHGKALHAEDCAGCHASRFGGDGSAIYTRPDHKIRSAAALAQQIDTCSANLGNKLFPEDEADIGAYLNQTYYKFK
jgi:mono/diheme cytochrome c family protein